MVIDSSALIALLLGEPEAGRVVAALARRGRLLLPASCYLECSIVLARKQGEAGLALLDPVIVARGIEVTALTPEHAVAAREAFLRFGKGRHPAALNFGDCMSYGVARVERQPLLFVGEDFARTDVVAA